MKGLEMKDLRSSGWRAISPTPPLLKDLERADKQALFEAARVAAKVLGLSTNCRFVLDQLCGVYGGELIENRILVWPANEYLVERTNISERSVRYAISQLIREGIIVAKDSPNGKRFAQRSARGQIIRAYGFDLSPLIHRLDEFKQRLQAIKDAERERMAVYDQMTIHRRAAQETLRTIAEVFPDVDTSDLTQRALELAKVTPRRGAKGSAVGACEEWQQLRQEAETRYYSATGGNNCRHKDNNKYTPDQSCNNGYEDVRAQQPPREAFNAGDLAKACPDAMEFVGEIRNDRELVGMVSRLRGSFGVSPSAWEEACREIGALGAAATLVYVVQLQIRPAPGVDPIKNVGGYFRALIRLIKAGDVNLAEELLRLKVRI